MIWVILVPILFFLSSFVCGAFLYIYSLRRIGKKAERKRSGIIFCLLCGVFSTLFALKFYPDDPFYVLLCSLSTLLLGAISLCDETDGYIPDELIFFLFLTAFVNSGTENYINILVVFLDCGAFFFCLRIISQFILSTETIGWGDIKLAACAGGLLGGPRAVIALVAAVFFATVGSTLHFFLVPRDWCDLPLKNEKEAEFFPLASSLSAGTLFSLFLGTDIIAALLSPFGVV